MKKLFLCLLIIILSCCPASAETVKIAAVGDLMVHEAQLERAAVKNGFDFDRSFKCVADILSSADITVGNFETTLAGPEREYTGYPCFKTPDAFAEALKRAGFDILMTANNHCMDAGINGLLRTVRTLRRLGFLTTGTFSSHSDRHNILIKEANGIKIAFLSWTYGTNGIPIPKGKEWAVAKLSARTAAEDIARAKALSPDVIIAMPHLGTEYLRRPPAAVRKMVESIISAGADIVIAGHPHVVQQFEFRRLRGSDGREREAFIAWSMGNFISFQRTPPRDTGAILELTLEKKAGVTRVTSADVIPTWVQIRQRSGTRTVRVLPLSYAIKAPDSFEISYWDRERLKAVRKDFAENALELKQPSQDAPLRFEIKR